VNNYEYIIAGLPVLDIDSTKAVNINASAILDDILEQLSTKDRKVMEAFLDGFDTSKLDAGFYLGMRRSPNSFSREFFEFDRRLRNTKVEYINRTLERDRNQDILLLDEDEEFSPDPEIVNILEKEDLLEREKGLDALVWDFIEERTIMHVFDLDVILGFTGKLKIVDRWLRLDPGTGREYFIKLVKEIRNSLSQVSQVRNNRFPEAVGRQFPRPEGERTEGEGVK